MKTKHIIVFSIIFLIGIVTTFSITSFIITQSSKPTEQKDIRLDDKNDSKNNTRTVEISENEENPGVDPNNDYSDSILDTDLTKLEFEVRQNGPCGNFYPDECEALAIEEGIFGIDLEGNEYNLSKTLLREYVPLDANMRIVDFMNPFPEKVGNYLFFMGTNRYLYSVNLTTQEISQVSEIHTSKGPIITNPEKTLLIVPMEEHREQMKAELLIIQMSGDTYTIKEYDINFDRMENFNYIGAYGKIEYIPATKTIKVTAHAEPTAPPSQVSLKDTPFVEIQIN